LGELDVALEFYIKLLSHWPNLFEIHTNRTFQIAAPFMLL
jgi:hypothetical protein